MTDRENLFNITCEAADFVVIEGTPCVFAPPLCTLHNKYRAWSQDIAQGLVLTVELDNHPQQSLARLREMLGQPTLVMESGSLWTDELFDRNLKPG